MASMLDSLIKPDKPVASSPSDSMGKLQDVLRSSAYVRAKEKQRGRIMGAPATTLELSSAEKQALADAERYYNTASVIPGPPRKDLDYTGVPISPALPPNTGPKPLSFTMDIAKEPNPIVRRALASQAIAEIQHGKGTALSNAYYQPDNADHETVVANVAALYELMNKEK